jgi:hypothetical protein
MKMISHSEPSNDIDDLLLLENDRLLARPWPVSPPEMRPVESDLVIQLGMSALRQCSDLSNRAAGGGVLEQAPSMWV